MHYSLRSTFDPLAINGNQISVGEPVLTCKINQQAFTTTVNSNFSLSVSIIDKVSGNKINDINWNVIETFSKLLFKNFDIISIIKIIQIELYMVGLYQFI